MTVHNPGSGDGVPVDLTPYQLRNEKGDADGYVPLDGTGTIDEAFFPTFPVAGQVIADPAVPDGTSDNTSYLTGLNATAIAQGKILRVPKGSSGDWCIREWTLPTDSLIDARGATFKMPASGSPKRLVRNTSQTLGTPGSTRDKRITIIGGIWDHGTITGITGPDAQTLMFAFLDGLVIRNITVRSSGSSSVGGQYAVYGWNVTQFDIDGIDANPSVTSAAIQFTQCSRGKIKNVTGVTGDDSVALMPRDVVSLEFVAQTTMGDIHNIEVDGVYTTSSRNGTKVLAGTLDDGTTILKARNITFRNIDVQAGNTGQTCALWIGGDPNPSYKLGAGKLENILAENITQRLSSTQAVRIESADNTTIENVTLRRIRNVPGTTEPISVDNGTIGLLRVEDCYWAPTGSNYGIRVRSGVTVRKLVMSNVRIVGPTTGTPTIALVQLANGATVGSLVVENCSAGGKVFSVAEIGVTTSVFVRGVTGEDSNHQGYLRLVTGAVATVKEASMTTAAVDDITVAAGSLTSQAQGMRCDVNSIQRSANSLCWNTNAARSCGVGPVVCDGTTWTHLITSATF